MNIKASIAYTALFRCSSTENNVVDYKSYTINFYGDDKLLKSFTINKGDLPQDISVNLKHCKKLKIEFVRPSGDNTTEPPINLIEFGLVI